MWVTAWPPDSKPLPRLGSVSVAVTEGDHYPAPTAFGHEVERTGQFGGEGDHRDRTGVAQRGQAVEVRSRETFDWVGSGPQS